MSDRRVQETLARRALVCLDLTNLEETCDAAAVEALCRRGQTEHGSVAAVCIWPRFVGEARRVLDATGTPVATVVNFPSGEAPLADTLALTASALGDGADEIDLVIPWRRLAAGEVEAAGDYIVAVKSACGSATLKTILETGELADPATIAVAADCALKAGADFLKTSTGKVKVNATPQAAEILLDAIARSGKPAGLKPAGGVRTVEDAGVYLALCDRIMGAGWAGPKHFRIGASGLLDAILATLQGSEDADADDGY